MQSFKLVPFSVCLHIGFIIQPWKLLLDFDGVVLDTFGNYTKNKVL